MTPKMAGTRLITCTCARGKMAFKRYGAIFIAYRRDWQWYREASYSPNPLLMQCVG